MYRFYFCLHSLFVFTRAESQSGFRNERIDTVQDKLGLMTKIQGTSIKEVFPKEFQQTDIFCGRVICDLWLLPSILGNNLL